MTESSDTSSFDHCWADLEVPFRESIELAWQAVAKGTIGVGSVITLPDGETIARGRNSVYDIQPDGGPLYGTKVAHAEMNALSTIPTSTALESCTLWTSLQPCILCTGAIVMAGVGQVRFLAADPQFAGIDRIPSLNPWVAEHWPVYDGPSGNIHWEIAALILQLNAAATRDPDGEVMALAREGEPEAAKLIVEIVDSGMWRTMARARSNAREALEAVWPRLVRAAEMRRDRRS